jgi:tetratricopeptide (TPR) repeat protein
MKAAYKSRPQKSFVQQDKFSLLQSIYFQAGIVLLLTFFCWLGALENGLTNWDDEGYITKNALMELPFPSLKAHFSEYIMGNYHPLTTLSLHFNKIFWENPVKGYHLSNLLLHLLNTLLVLLLVKQIPGVSRFALGSALLFGIHPLHVESVAWVSERKDVLYSSFFIGALFLQALWLNRKIPLLLYCPGLIFLFILSALSKGVAVSLGPLLLLNLWYWGRIQDKKEWLVPGIVLLLSIGVGLIAIAAQQSSDSIKSLGDSSLWLRPFYTLFALSAYLGKIFLPIRLSCFYPYPNAQDWLLWVGSLGIVALIATLILKKQSLPKLFIWGLVFFFINVLPVMQILPVGEALYADRYTYLALIGIVIAAWGIIPEKIKNGTAGLALLLLVSLAFAYLTRQRIPVWKDSLSLWNNMIQTYPDGYFVAYNNRAIALHEQKRYAEALRDFDKAISMYPQYKDALYNRGTSRAEIGDKEGAIVDFTAAISLQPDFQLAWYNRGNSYAMLGKMEEAEKDYLEAVKLNPKYPEAWTNLGNVYGMRKESAKAEAAYTHSIQLQPDNAQAFNNRALSRVALGNTAGAIADFEAAILIYERNQNKASADETRRNRQIMIPSFPSQ